VVKLIVKLVRYGPRSLPLLAALLAASCYDPEPDEREVTAEILHGAPVTGVAFSPDDTVLASASEDDTIRLLDVEDFHVNFDLPAATTQMVQELDSSPLLGLGTGFRAVAFSPDGSSVAGGNYRFVDGGIVKVWDIETGGKLEELKLFSGPVLALDYADIEPGSGRAFGGGFPDTVGEGLLIHTYLEGGASELQGLGMGPVNDLEFSPDGSRLAVACEDGAIRVYSCGGQAGLLLELAEDDHTPRALTFSPDGLELASVGDDSGMGFHGHGGLVRIWDVEQGELTGTLDLDPHPLRAVDYSHDGALIAAAGESHRVLLVDPWSGVLVDVLDGHAGTVNSLDFAANGQLLASASDDLYVRLWHVGDLVGATCNDGMDNDGDGWIDANDPDCEDGPRELGFTDTECNDDLDNDGDTHTDAADPDCDSGFDNTEHETIDGGPADSGAPDGGPDDGGPDAGK
jgi:WD40 repeat protein